MSTIHDLCGSTCTSSAVLLADGSLESTMLAYLYAERASQQGQEAYLTLLSPHKQKSHDPAATRISALCQTISRRYPLLALEQQSVDAGLAPSLFSRQDFTQRITQFLWLVEYACTYGSTLFIPLYRDRVILPGVPSPLDVIEAVNSWLEHLSVQPLRVVAPFQEQSLQAIVELGMQLGVDLAKTFDCEEPVDGQEPCLICQRCVSRAQALASVLPASSRQTHATPVAMPRSLDVEAWRNQQPPSLRDIAQPDGQQRGPDEQRAATDGGSDQW